jgi:hypothetical protein
MGAEARGDAMSPEELDRALAQRDEARRLADVPPPQGVGSAGAAAQSFLRSVLSQPREPAEIAQARAEARADALAARKQRLLEERVALQRRIHGRLMNELRKKPTPCALLMGPTGCGKTSAALWLRSGFPGEWLGARELGACERRHPLGDGAPPAFELACAARVLYLDDLGAEDQRDVPVLQHVLDQRYSRTLATVTTTGLTAAQLTERYGAATVRRMVDQHVTHEGGLEWSVLVVDLHDKVTA